MHYGSLEQAAYYALSETSNRILVLSQLEMLADEVTSAAKNEICANLCSKGMLAKDFVVKTYHFS